MLRSSVALLFSVWPEIQTDPSYYKHLGKETDCVCVCMWWGGGGRVCTPRIEEIQTNKRALCEVFSPLPPCGPLALWLGGQRSLSRCTQVCKQLVSASLPSHWVEHSWDGIATCSTPAGLQAPIGIRLVLCFCLMFN